MSNRTELLQNLCEDGPAFLAKDGGELKIHYRHTLTLGGGLACTRLRQSIPPAAFAAPPT